MVSLQFEPNYWDTRLSGMKNASIQTKLHLILSLVIFLGVSVSPLIDTVGFIDDNGLYTFPKFCILPQFEETLRERHLGRYVNHLYFCMGIAP